MDVDPDTRTPRRQATATTPRNPAVAKVISLEKRQISSSRARWTGPGAPPRMERRRSIHSAGSSRPSSASPLSPRSQDGANGWEQKEGDYMHPCAAQRERGLSMTSCRTGSSGAPGSCSPRRRLMDALRVDRQLASTSDAKRSDKRGDAAEPLGSPASDSSRTSRSLASNSLELSDFAAPEPCDIDERKEDARSKSARAVPALHVVNPASNATGEVVLFDQPRPPSGSREASEERTVLSRRNVRPYRPHLREPIQLKGK